MARRGKVSRRRKVSRRGRRSMNRSKVSRKGRRGIRTGRKPRSRSRLIRTKRNKRTKRNTRSNFRRMRGGSIEEEINAMAQKLVEEGLRAKVLEEQIAVEEGNMGDEQFNFLSNGNEEIAYHDFMDLWDFSGAPGTGASEKEWLMQTFRDSQKRCVLPVTCRGINHAEFVRGMTALEMAFKEKPEDAPSKDKELMWIKKEDRVKNRKKERLAEEDRMRKAEEAEEKSRLESEFRTSTSGSDLLSGPPWDRDIPALQTGTVVYVGKPRWRTRIGMDRWRRGTYQSFERKLVGANLHTIRFDDGGGTETLNLRDIPEPWKFVPK